MRSAGRALLSAASVLTLFAAPGGTGAREAAQTRPVAGDARPSGGGRAAAPTPAPATTPRAYLIYLTDGNDPIVVKRYVEEGDQIRFEKFGGWVGLPKYEVLRIVPDEPDRTANLPPPPPLPEAEPAAPAAGTERLYVMMRGGASAKATAVSGEGERVRVTVPDGSFTVPRSDLAGVIRVPAAGTPEAWLSVLSTDAVTRAPDTGQPPPASIPRPDPLAPSTMASSDRPHLLRLAGGQVLRVDGFWIEDGEIRFRRLGGMVGIALSEVARLLPEEPASVNGRTPVRFAQQLGPDLLEVRVQSGVQHVRLIGVEPVPGAQSAETPWEHLERGLVIYLEFDRQRYTPGGEWLAYVFLPNGRMLNVELLRLGLARPRPDGRNLRYLDLFQEIATARALEPDGLR